VFDAVEVAETALAHASDQQLILPCACMPEHLLRGPSLASAEGAPRDEAGPDSNHFYGERVHR